MGVVWLFVRGVALEFDRIVGELLIGLAVGLLIAFALRRFYATDVSLGRVTRVAPYAAVFLLVFVKDLVVANFDVAYRVLAPSLPIEPDVVEVPLRVRSDLAITTIANSITLTPGTLTMDYDESRNSLYVHAITGRDTDAVIAPIRVWEDYALIVFDEEGTRDVRHPRGGETGGD
jgi:multicomponent Na+:H+ antiporter subunit E